MVEKKTQPPGLTSWAQAFTVLDRAGHVLQHFHAGNHVVMMGLFFGKFFHGHLAVIHLLAAFQQVQLCNFERFIARSIPVTCAARSAMLSDKMPPPQPTSSTVLPAKPQLVDIIQPQRVDFMQWLEFTGRVPPAVRELADFSNSSRSTFTLSLSVCLLIMPLCGFCWHCGVKQDSSSG